MGQTSRPRGATRRTVRFSGFPGWVVPQAGPEARTSQRGCWYKHGRVYTSTFMSGSPGWFRPSPPLRDLQTGHPERRSRYNLIGMHPLSPWGRFGSQVSCCRSSSLSFSQAAHPKRTLRAIPETLTSSSPPIHGASAKVISTQIRHQGLARRVTQRITRFQLRVEEGVRLAKH